MHLLPASFNLGQPRNDFILHSSIIAAGKTQFPPPFSVDTGPAESRAGMG